MLCTDNSLCTWSHTDNSLCTWSNVDGHALVGSLSQNAVGVAAVTIHHVHKEMVSSGE
jgi:hypothetical protein